MENSQAVLEDGAARGTAGFDLGKNIVVEAGAGTGKTTLLIRRLSALLLGPKDAPTIEEIVALTFTEKSAGDIKLRLAQTLSDASAFLESEALTEKPQEQINDLISQIEERFKSSRPELIERCRQALTDLDKAAIGTIHSFAARILRLYPVEAGVDPDFTVDDSERFFDDLFESEWAKWLDIELGENPPRKDAWLEVLTRAPLESVEAMARALCHESEDLDLIGQAQPGVASEFLTLAKSLEDAARMQPKVGANSKINESLAAVLARLKGMAEALTQNNPSWPKTREPSVDDIVTKEWPKSWAPELAPLYARARGLAVESSGEDETLARLAARLLRPFAESFRKAYTRRGFISFDGLLRRARDLVRDHVDVRNALKHRYRAFLIDEFQDTDPLQGEFLLFLAEEPGGRSRSWPEAKLAPGRIFVVGDPKQSIYRFRGADMAAYQRFTKFILSMPSAESCALSVNFRSPKEILSPVNAIFPAIMSFEPDLQPEYKALYAAQPRAEAKLPAPALEFVLAVDGQGEEALKADESRQAQFVWIARWVAEHCGPGKKWGFKDAAVLLRSSSSLLPLLDAFKSQGIPYAVEIEKSFYGAPEIIDFLNLLSALDDPGDKIALAGLLRSPLCALDDADLYRLACGKALSYLRAPAPGLLPQESQARVAGFFAALRRLRAKVGREPLSDLTRRALGEIPFLELASCAYHGEQSAANILKFARLATQSSEDMGLSLREFVDFVRRERENPNREGESPLADEHLEAARVLTIHKAKGLEFPVVFLADACAAQNSSNRKEGALFSNWSSGVVGLRLPKAACGASMAWLEMMEEERQEKETVRLLYVAMTRAKEKIFVLGGKKPRDGSLAAWLKAAGAWPGEAQIKGMSLGGVAVPVHQAQPQIENSARGLKSCAQSWSALDVAALAALWKKRLAARETALSRQWVTTPTQALKEPVKRFFVAGDEELSAERAAAADIGALIGQVCHRVLQGWDFKTAAPDVLPGLKAGLGPVIAALKRQEPEAHWVAVEDETQKILVAFLTSPASRNLAKAEILGREIPFVYDEDGTVMRGTIDLLLRENGRLMVIDYKSEKISAKDLAARQEKYAAQGDAYVKAVEKTLGEKPEFRLIFLREPGLGAS